MKIFEVTALNKKYVQVFLRISALALLPLISLSMTNFVWAFFCYLFYYTISHSIMLHRYYGHSLFEFKNKYIRWLFALITTMSVRGSPIGWAYLHRLHHSNVDTKEDPHSPYFKKFNIFEIRDYNDELKHIDLSKIKKLITRENVFIGKYYWLICFLIPSIMLIIDLNLFYFAWLLPIVLFDIFSTFFNYANHKPILGSYIPFAGRHVGYSNNNYLLWFLSLGEAWHNNHHHNPSKFNFKVKWWELDPSAVIITLVKK
jgi:stearoyl-CoA desaturase (delta-9 desaturase)